MFAALALTPVTRSRRTRPTHWLAGVASLLAACSFGGEEEPLSPEQNSCIVDSDCPSRSCEAGRCVALSETPLQVALYVTPKRMPDGSQPMQLVSTPFKLQAGPQQVSLQLPASTPVRVHQSGLAIPAQVRFTPILASNPFVTKVVQIDTLVALDSQRDAPANAVMLAPGVEYSVTIQPANPELASHTTRFMADGATPFEVDYASIAWESRFFSVKDAPGGYSLRARTKGGSALRSNTVAIPDSGFVGLFFDPGEVAYDLELVSTNQPSYSSDAGDCGGEEPRPTLSIDGSTLKQERGLFEPWVVEFPKLPSAVPYAANITLCETRRPATATELPVLITSSKLAFSAMNSSATGAFEVTATARWNDDTQAYNVCARLLPGEYTVVVTPPTSVSCSVVAERRIVSARDDDDDDAREPDSLTFGNFGTLSGRVLTPDLMPVANASVDLSALTKNTITLAEDDRAVPMFNRSGHAITDTNGDFDLPVDLGSYDVLIKPPAQSNFAWQVVYGVDVASRMPYANDFYVTAPVVVDAKLTYSDGSSRDQSSLASAEVHAYALVNEQRPGQRPVEIAQGQLDAQGNVTLLMPPKLQHTWIPE
ncbi:MAG: hypothetical protein ABW321_26580 [Polyangiales bacterium]